jgi:hypothetical protein
MLYITTELMAMLFLSLETDNEGSINGVEQIQGAREVKWTNRE